MQFLFSLCRNGVVRQDAVKLQRVTCPLRYFSRNILGLKRLLKAELGRPSCNSCSDFRYHCKLQSETASRNKLAATCNISVFQCCNIDCLILLQEIVNFESTDIHFMHVAVKQKMQVSNVVTHILDKKICLLNFEDNEYSQSPSHLSQFLPLLILSTPSLSRHSHMVVARS